MKFTLSLLIFQLISLFILFVLTITKLDNKLVLLSKHLEILRIRRKTISGSFVTDLSTLYGLRI